MVVCGMLGSMSLEACCNSYSFIPQARLVEGRAGSCHRINGVCLPSHSFKLRFLRSASSRWKWNSSSWDYRNGCCQSRAGGGSNNDRRKNDSSSKNGQSRGRSEKNVDRNQRDNVWSTGGTGSSAKSLSKKESQGRRSGVSNKSKGGGHPRVAVSSRRGPTSGEKKIAHDNDEELEFLKYLSPPLPTENEKVIHPEESFPSPLWKTFCSSVSGVWRGVGAAFSPITAELEALYLNNEDEYLYDARILNTVEVVRTAQNGDSLTVDKQYLRRRVLWSLENQFGENGLGEVRVAEDADGENVRLNGFLGNGTPYSAASTSGVDDLGYWEDDEEDEDEAMDYDAEWEYVVGTKEDIDGRWEDERPDTLDVIPELNIDVESIREDGREWRAMWGGKEVLEGDWQPVGSPVEEMAPPPFIPPSTAGPTYSPDHLTDALGTTWADVMEEDVMDEEEGLVYFEDGSYSRGPLELLTETSTSGREYFNAYTCKIEQCLVAGGHKRVRILHTVQVESQGELVEVLRVAVYEEEWMGPCDLESISDARGQLLELYSVRPRHLPQELIGTWKVFEKEALAYIPPKNSSEKASFSHSSREISITRGLPEMPEENLDYDPQDEDEPVDMTEFSTLWLTGGVSTYVDVDETGMLTFGFGWLSATGSRLVIERVYGKDGKLVFVKSKTEMEASLGVPM